MLKAAKPQTQAFFRKWTRESTHHGGGQASRFPQGRCAAESSNHGIVSVWVLHTSSLSAFSPGGLLRVSPQHTHTGSLPHRVLRLLSQIAMFSAFLMYKEGGNTYCDHPISCAFPALSHSYSPPFRGGCIIPFLHEETETQRALPHSHS